MESYMKMLNSMNSNRGKSDSEMPSRIKLLQGISSYGNGGGQGVEGLSSKIVHKIEG